MKISVVAIFYNSVPWMRRCIDSILSQQGNFELELIAVDDCSTDDTYSVLKGYQDSRVKIVRHERNRGISAARNTGLGHVSGDCFYLIDGDDLMPKDALSKLVADFADDVDWVQGGYAICDEDGKELSVQNNPDAVYGSHRQIVDNFGKLEFTWIHNRLVNSRLKDVPFPEGKLIEDVTWNVVAFPRLSKIINVSASTYCRIERPASVSHSAFHTKAVVNDAFDLLPLMRARFEDGWPVRAYMEHIMFIEKLLHFYYLGMGTDFLSQCRRKLRMFSDVEAARSWAPPFSRLRHRLLVSQWPDWVVGFAFRAHKLFHRICPGFVKKWRTARWNRAKASR